MSSLTEIMNKHGSDKGNGGQHNYTEFYSGLLIHLVDNPGVKIFELGIGTNNPALPSTMGVDGTPGASLRGWRDWFNQADIYGADIDKDILFTEDRIQTFYVDQRSPESISDMWKEIDVMFDLIIDDGLHELDANYTFVSNSYHKLKPGGYFIIEDVKTLGNDNKIREFISNCQKFFNDVKFLKIPNRHNPVDNNIFLFKK
jgi:hypothetical protein